MSGTPKPSARWAGLPTEARHADGDLDLRSSAELVEQLLEEDRRGLDAALAQRRQIARVADLVAETLHHGGDVLLAGAGTSGRLAVLEAAECPPTFGTDPRRIRAAIAGGEEAVFRAREGSEDRHDDGEAAAAGLSSSDLLIGLSASSVTPYTRGALLEARRRGATTVLLTCAGAGRLAEVADHLLALDTGPELLTGSTRLKAGSATKAALNAITTVAMVRLGKVYDNLMVDLRPGSAKLKDRARRIVAQATGVGEAAAAELYEAADGEVKTAIVMGLRKVDAGEARKRLAESGGQVRAALDKADER